MTTTTARGAVPDRKATGAGREWAMPPPVAGAEPAAT